MRVNQINFSIILTKLKTPQGSLHSTCLMEEGKHNLGSAEKDASVKLTIKCEAK